MMPVARAPDQPPLELIETEIVEVKPERTSSSGTPYCALVLPSGDWVFAWEGDWKTEIEDHVADYEGLDAKLYVRDKEDDPDDHFYNLEAVVPADRAACAAFFERTRREAAELSAANSGWN